MPDRDPRCPPEAKAESHPSRPRRLPWGTLLLILLHGVTFGLIRTVGREQAALFRLQGNVSHPAAIVLHPLGTRHPIVLAALLAGLWLLGKRLESRLATSRLLCLYAGGNALAGAAYFGFAQLAPDLAGLGLAVPAGGFAAWTVAARELLSDRAVSLLGRSFTAGRLALTVGMLIVAVVFFFGEQAATGWLLAAGCGAVAWPAARLLAPPPHDPR